MGKKNIISTGYALSALSAALLCMMSLMSCINESDAGCVQCAVKPYLVNSAGVQHNDTSVKSITAYLFSDEKFDREVKSESDGRFLVSFNGSLGTSLVLLGYPGNDSLSVNIPKEGESIEEVSSSVLSSKGNRSPEGFYYGCFNYESSASDTVKKEVSVAMHTERATIHVVVEELISVYGDGDYSITLSGMRSTVGFDGTIGGDSVTYNPKTSFDTQGNLCSEAVSTLPTKTGESVTVTIYGNGLCIWQSSKDSSGKDVTLSSGDDKAVIIDVARKDIGISVMQWSDYINQKTTIY